LDGRYANHLECLASTIDSHFVDFLPFHSTNKPVSNMSKWAPQQCSVLLLILLAPGLDGLPLGYIPPVFPDVDPGCIKQCKLLGSLEPMTEIDEYTAPKNSSSEKYSLENVCGGLDRRADRGAGAGYAWCNLAFEAGTAIASLPALIGLSYGIQAFDTWSKFMVRAHVHECLPCLQHSMAYLHDMHSVAQVVKAACRVNVTSRCMYSYLSYK
jgi:hypothetical protein